MLDIRRREFITLLGGAVAWPLAARAQQADRVRRIGALMTQTADDPEGQARLLASAQGLQESGWTIGRNMRIDTRWGAGDAERYRRYAAELVALAPDVILVNGPAALAQLQQATRSLPIVFTNVTDPVGAGFIVGVARPGGNATGFMLSEYSTSGKSVEPAQGDRATRDANGDPSGSYLDLLCCPVRRHPQRALISRLGPEPDRYAQSGLDRAYHRRVRARLQWRADRHDGRMEHASQPDRHACGPAPAASSVPVPLLRRGRRPDLVRA